MMLRIVVFAEAVSDAQLGCELGDRVFIERGPDWIDNSHLPDLRAWTGVDRETSFTKWTALKETNGRVRRPRYIGHATNGPRGSDYAMAFKALTQVALITGENASSIAVVMLRDCDSVADKRSGLRQAAEESRFARYPVVVGIADKMREAWVLNGYQPQNNEETARLTKLKRELGFDPTREAERLRATQANELRHPKRVLVELTDGDVGREALCWRETPLDLLRAVGLDAKENGPTCTQTIGPFFCAEVSAVGSG